MRFEYCVELKEGYNPVMQDDLENDIKFVIEAKNRVTADRLVSAMLKNAPNIKEFSGICIGE